ncbi:IclR family transcriptional regulator [Acetobacter orleanensis]|uniref:IclR family transcriptional regulator n=1 Tax=Acetobacter orleanensis TaxID=104099 RepID=A0A4Y3TQK2_9PROT|nr:IclR family transcriptional regulator [Acetobacter orleanensis]KXV65591.1 IclR family transcriptional regulator [Acetobacter orleanensis]PCD79127.1 IclR family transcriptional regulator [Acetobacter orleanensis]GAN67728.1 transcriptional regulator IclR [Acetobacter orleanensis JCM 7639]GBR22146.1 IclR family transcriptional regulator [Acetobacter orleanensis NRIC 0473]GEB83065.1 IclR family transcriptional regulator [Acetobacter orleanensis]
MSKAHDSVPALRRAVRILDLVKSTERPPLAADIARQLELPRSTVHGLVAVMVELGLLEKTVMQGYRLGTRLMDWAGGMTEQRDLVTEFYQTLEAFSDLAAFTVTLTVLEDTEVVYMACRNSATVLGASFRVGMRLPAIFTATGNAMLAGMDDSAFREWLTLHPASSWPDPLTPNGIRSVTTLVREIADIRDRGYAVDDEQIHDGLWCFGAGVKDHSGQMVAGVGLSLPQTELGRYDVRELGFMAERLAQALSRRLGYRPAQAESV